MLYSMRSALCKSQAGDDFCSGILRSSGGDFAAQVKASVAPGHSPALGALVGFCFADEVLGCSMVFRSRQIVTFCFASPFVVASYRFIIGPAARISICTRRFADGEIVARQTCEEESGWHTLVGPHAGFWFEVSDGIPRHTPPARVNRNPSQPIRAIPRPSSASRV
jgi:uncharacterized protein YbaR (Trm112 family)